MEITMKALKIFLFIILFLVALVAVLGIMAPKEYRVERSMTVAASRDVVFENIKYWNKWQAWLPWAKDDSTMNITYSGVDGVVGSGYRWTGETAGSGEMTATALKPNEEIGYHLKFITPYESQADGYVRIADAEGGTKVTWAMFGKDPFPWNIMMLFMNMDKMIGKDFERGLTMLKQISEKEDAKISGYQIMPVDAPARFFAAIRKEVKFIEIEQFYAAAFSRIMRAAQQKGVKIAGMPCGLYYTWDEAAQSTAMAAAMPISVKKELGEGIELITLPKGKAYVIDYYGPYDQSMLAYKAMDRYFAKNGLKQAAPIIEEYLTDPGQEPDQSKWLTKIYFHVE
jgi:effector-binding domain-containing protein